MWNHMLTTAACFVVWLGSQLRSPEHPCALHCVLPKTKIAKKESAKRLHHTHQTRISMGSVLVLWSCMDASISTLHQWSALEHHLERSNAAFSTRLHQTSLLAIKWIISWMSVWSSSLKNYNNPIFEATQSPRQPCQFIPAEQVACLNFVIFLTKYCFLSNNFFFQHTEDSLASDDLWFRLSALPQKESAPAYSCLHLASLYKFRSSWLCPGQTKQKLLWVSKTTEGNVLYPLEKPKIKLSACWAPPGDARNHTVQGSLSFDAPTHCYKYRSSNHNTTQTLLETPDALSMWQIFYIHWLNRLPNAT